MYAKFLGHNKSCGKKLTFSQSLMAKLRNNRFIIVTGALVALILNPAIRNARKHMMIKASFIVTFCKKVTITVAHDVKKKNNKNCTLALPLALAVPRS